MVHVAGPSLEEFQAARGTISRYLHRTPLMPSSTLSQMTGADLYVKAENLQKTGSFKPRGALTAVSKLSAADRARGVITMSAGNMGQGVAFAAAQFGCPCTVVIREDATKGKIEALRGYGAEVVLAPIARWRQRLDEEQLRRQQAFIHPFGTPEVVVGQGTLGLELLEELPDVSTVVVPVGGGGLISGVAAAVKQQQPRVRVVGVEPEGSAVVQLSLQKGSPQRLDRLDTIADGLAAPWTEEYNLAIIRQHVDEMVSVSDREIALALVMILERMKLLVEPAGAAAVAALLARRVTLAPREKTIAILSGGNADADKLRQVFSLVSGSG